MGTKSPSCRCAREPHHRETLGDQRDGTAGVDRQTVVLSHWLDHLLVPCLWQTVDVEDWMWRSSPVGRDDDECLR